jgi:methionyl-tRNA formyltransferase
MRPTVDCLDSYNWSTMKRNLKVVFITQNDPFYTKFFFDKYVSVQKSDYDLKGVFFLSPMRDSFFKLIKRTYSFYGIRNFLSLGLKYTFIKIGEKLGVPTTAPNILKKHGIPVYSISSVNDEGHVNWVRQNEIDIIVSISCPQIFKSDLLSSVRIACINIHSGKIPAYRGLFPNFWQMYNNERFATLTVHKMEERVDKGNIIYEYPIEILSTDSLTDLVRKSKEHSVAALHTVLAKFKTGQVKTYDNRDVAPGYYKFPQGKDVKEFKKRGKRIL